MWGCGTVRRRGTFAVLTALLIVVLLGCMALAFDISWLVAVGAELQTVADNSALAAARRVRSNIDAARTWAVDIANDNWAAHENVQLDRNDANAADGDVVVGRFDLGLDTFTETTFPNPDPPTPWPNAVKVVARRTQTSLNGTLPLTFGPVLGLDTASPERTAIAMITGSTGDGIIALCPDCKCAFKNNGTPLLNVGDAAIQVNSSHNHAACGIGTSETAAGEINIVGGKQITGNAEFLADVTEGAPSVPDPLAGLPVPSYNPANDHACVDDVSDGMLTPGYFGAGIRHTSGTLTLSPGVYVLGNAVDFTPKNVDFDNSGAEAGITVPGATDFEVLGASWTGGTVGSYATTDDPPVSMSGSGAQSYGVTSGPASVTFDPPVKSVDFYFVHDGVTITQGTATGYDVCGGVVGTVNSNAMADPDHYESFSTGDRLLERIDFTGGLVDAVTLTPTSDGLHIGGGSTFTANNVMFYLAGGQLDIKGGAITTITAPDSGTYEGVSFFQARDNTNEASINGNSETVIQGKLYFPVAPLKIAGTPDEWGNQIIAWTITISGTAGMHLDYPGDESNNLKIFLVK